MSAAAPLREFVSDSATVLRAGGDSPILVDDGAQLFGAEFRRAGRDLLLLNDAGPPIRIVDYFVHATPPDLVSGNGGLLRGATVEKLAGPVAPGQYADAGGAISAEAPIGQVESLEGGARVQHADGTVETLRIGAKVFLNDVVTTDEGGALSLTFADGTIFSLAPGSRMVLDQFLYDPAATGNSGAFSLVQGSFVFIAGQVAKTGGLDVTTPAATMGVRGTTVKVDVTTIGGETTVETTLNHDPDGGLGRIEILDLDGNLLQTVTGADYRWQISGTDGDLMRLPRTPSDLARDMPLLDDAKHAFRMALRRVASGETFVDMSNRDDRGDADAPDPAAGSGEELSGDPGAPADLPGGIGDPEGGGRPEIRPTFPPPPDTAPELDDTRIETDEDGRVAGILPGSDADGDALTFSLVEGPANGQVEVLEGGGFVYVPDPDFAGTDSFVYAVTDEDGNTASATATVAVAAVNDAPVMAGAAFEAQADTYLAVDLAALADDPDPGEDGSTLSYTVRLAGQDGAAIGDDGPDAGGVLALDGTVLTFTPGDELQGLVRGETATVVLEVTATDAAGASTTAFLTVTVHGTAEPVASPPGAPGDGIEDEGPGSLPPDPAAGGGVYEPDPVPPEGGYESDPLPAKGGGAYEPDPLPPEGGYESDPVPAEGGGVYESDPLPADGGGAYEPDPLPPASDEALDGGLLPVADLAQGGVLDLENGTTDAMTLSLSDVLDLTDAGEPGIGALVEAAGPVLNVYGDAGDVVTLSTEPGQDVQMSAADATPDGLGHDMVIYEFVDGAGEILASLAIDADVTVQTMAAPA